MNCTPGTPYLQSFLRRNKCVRVSIEYVTGNHERSLGLSPQGRRTLPKVDPPSPLPCLMKLKLDRARLASLYSDFRQQRATNRDGYVANINAWMTGLAAAAKAGLLPANENSILTLSCGPELLKALETREWGQPAALEAVVVGSRSQGHVVAS